MKNIIYILLVLTIVSCDVQKVSDKTKDNSNYKEDTEIRTFRKGDTVRFEIPKISFKDTIIYRTNRQGTTIQTVYDKQGTVKSIDCYASRIEELTRQNIEYQKNSKLHREPKLHLSRLKNIVVLCLYSFFKPQNSLFLRTRHI